jgi:aspartate kinase
MSLLVMKFGGTSVGSAAAIEQLVTIIRDQLDAWDHVVVVVSAMSGVTDMLLQGAQIAVASGTTSRGSVHTVATALLEKHYEAIGALLGEGDEAAGLREAVEGLVAEFELLCHSVAVLGEATPRATDAISSLGERMSARLVAATLRAREVSAEAIDATELIVTTPHFGNAVPIHDATRVRMNARVRPLLERAVVPVITGFIGATEQGAVTTLGRGGSDYSGAIIGAALDADEVAIYTDVDGVMTTDPRLVPSARVIDTLSYSEMGELAYFGAKVLHPRTIRPVVERGIPLRIRNTFNPSHRGTLVVDAAGQSDRWVKAVSVVRGMSLITVSGRGMIGVPGVAARTFGAVASVGANVLMISQASSEQSICFVVQTSTTSQVVRALEDGLSAEIGRRDIDRVSALDGMVIVTAVGAGMRDTPGVAASVFGALAQYRINVIAIAQGSSECAISTVVRAEDADEAVRAIHQLTV